MNENIKNFIVKSLFYDDNIEGINNINNVFKIN
jgi:hypothetical protein